MIAANRYGWTDKLRGKFSSVRAEVEPGAKRFFCFPAGTLVRMGDGSTRPIEQVKAQDVVMSRDEETGQTGKQKVTQLFRHVAARTLRLRLSSGESIEATPEHPFYVQNKGFRSAKVLVQLSIMTTQNFLKVFTFDSDQFSVPDSEQGLMVIRGRRSDFTSLDKFWSKTAQVESYLDFDKGLWAPIDAAVLSKEVAGYTSDLKQKIDVDVSNPSRSYKISHEWDNSAVLAETPEEYIIVHWWTSA